jgi:hypothetical protein
MGGTSSGRETAAVRKKGGPKAAPLCNARLRYGLNLNVEKMS